MPDNTLWRCILHHHNYAFLGLQYIYSNRIIFLMHYFKFLEMTGPIWSTLESKSEHRYWKWIWNSFYLSFISLRQTFDIWISDLKLSGKITRAIGGSDMSIIWYFNAFCLSQYLRVSETSCAILFISSCSSDGISTRLNKIGAPWLTNLTGLWKFAVFWAIAVGIVAG